MDPRIKKNQKLLVRMHILEETSFVQEIFPRSELRFFGKHPASIQ